jgi:hypothetical protein
MLLTSIQPQDSPLIEFREPFAFLTIVSTPLHYTYPPPSAQQLLFPQYYLHFFLGYYFFLKAAI